MPTVQPSAPDFGHRRLLLGLLLSLLAHALVLSIQFGLPGLRAGGGAMAVRLAPGPPSAAPDPLPEAPFPATSQALAPVGPRALARAPDPGFRLFDPVPMAPPPAPQPSAKPARRRRPARRAVPRPAPTSTPVIVQQDNPDAAFKVPLAESGPAPRPPAITEPEAEAALATAQQDQRAAEDAGVLPRETDEEAQRLAQLRVEEAERQRLADIELERQRLADEERARSAERERLEQQASQREQDQRLAEERAAALRRQAVAEREWTRQIEEAAARERLLASEREAEVRRRQDEQARQDRARQQRLAEEEARSQALAVQRAIEEEGARARAAREAERQAAEETARRLAAERELAARQLAQELARQQEADAKRQRARQLAQQQAEDERLRRQRAEVIAAEAVQEELARQQAVQQARQQAHQAAEAERARQAALVPSPTGEGSGPSPSQGAGNDAGAGGSLPRGTLDGASLASRARELMRGIDLPGVPPAALRPAQQMADRRRRVVDTLERDVPLRLYVESFRQKIERNAAQIRMQLAGGPGRSDPVVSVAVRSDGSVDDVTIVHSSGRPDADEAVRRIVHLNARYAAFPPNVAARFDVIEIRRIWRFSETLKLLEEVR
jgi:TonB family protein